MKILVFGDVIGKIGRSALRETLPELREKYSPDLIIANAENAAHGKGITPTVLRSLLEAGVDFMTTGNHVFDKPDAFECFTDPDLSDKVIRPANYPPGAPGKGSKMLTVGTKNVLVINLMGRVLMKSGLDDPFRAFDEELKQYVSQKPNIVLVDFHGEASSEKQAFAWYVRERASAVWGTHTHVMTADARVLPEGGPAFITDLGMCGAQDGIIGFVKETAMQHYLTAMPMRSDVPDGGAAIVNAILIEANGKGQALSITPISQTLNI